ncbi:hypothetical protein EYZ11_008555 [Aspergillus tanneri]|uniref:CSN8/PSMD8/EIF3K domain-containing protein n=1 Tax=Aspergillus tanneri TaxID=1220188 RepID=A0A4S3JCC2_9EURO|nr:hypothetical protein EYZ11_008555 [Aspergillus tanneri]
MPSLLHRYRYEARALTQRVPQSVSQNDPSLQNCSVVLRAVWQRNYEQVYKALRELPWSEQLKPIVSKYDAHFQEKTFKEVSRAYEAIRPAAAASYLGLDPDLAEQGDPAIIQKFTAREWKWDKETKLLHPKPIPVVPETTGDPSQGLDQIMALISKYGG